MTTSQREEATARAEPPGIAGYVSPYPYLDRLQEHMEERLAHRVPAGGRFCGFCYGRLRSGEDACAFCGTAVGTGGRPTVEEIPQPVLRAYKAKQRTEASWVYYGAFIGLIVATALFLYLVVWAPGLLGHPAVGFTVLIVGGYGLAQLFGPLIAAQIGYRRGARKRDRLWAEFLAARDN
jgi:hypothetical protein